MRVSTSLIFDSGTASMQKRIADALKLQQQLASQRRMLTPSDDPVVLANGGNTYANLCGPCHRMDGGGLVGPNLTDDFWIHGPGFVDNLKVIWNGVPDKGMLSWKEVLNPDQIYAVASYIHTLRGREVPNPKPPEIQGAAPAQNVYE